MTSEELEQKNRTEIVAGIIIAGFAGFILNLLSNTYYDLFISKSITWDQINHFQIYGASLLIVGIIGLLNFFVADYRNNFEANKSFLKRFIHYFFYSFGPGKVIRIIVGLYILTNVLVVLSLIYLFIATIIGYLLATLASVMAVLGAYVRYRRERVKFKL